MSKPFVPGQAYVYSMMPREYMIDKLTAGERLYESPDGRLSFTAPRRRGLLTYYHQDAPARINVLAELLAEGWVTVEMQDGRRTFVRRKLKGRRLSYAGCDATITNVLMVWHARAGAAADITLKGGTKVRVVLADLHLLPE